MLIFWWQGKWFVTLLAFGIALVFVGAASDALHLQSYTSEFWAAAFGIAALANWVIGRRLNEKRRKTFGFMSPFKQLTYKARHKFMSLPMESWSVAMLAVAIFNAGSALLGSR